MNDQQLMQSIKGEWGAQIADACSASSVPESFVAALIANESGGDTDAKRFEKGVLASLWEVLLGRKASYGSIGRADLVAFVADLAAPPVQSPRALPADALQRIDRLATSRGLTQVMGYHTLEHASSLEDPMDLVLPARCLKETLRLLTEFAVRFHLDVKLDFEQLLRCWNTGEPDGRTFDPAYVANALNRKTIYEGLA
jgi:hypothetical protein